MITAVRSPLESLGLGILAICINLALMIIKIGVGLVGNSYALIADGIESASDIFSSVITWAGFRWSLKPADEDSGAVSPDSRTMLVELQVENSKNEILPGSYATVRVPQVALGKLVTLPDNTLIFRGKSVQVGIVDAKGVVQLRDVKVGRDFGIQSEILSGVTESDKVIVNPSDSLTTGTAVRVAATPALFTTPAPSGTPATAAKK
jgi:Cation efflux family